LFLALFSIGIGVGSMLCEKLSRQRLELGLVPIGSLGMSLFTLDLWFVGQPWSPPANPLTVTQFLSTFAGARICADLIGLSVFGGFLIVPLYTFVQARSSDAERSRIIAANNVVNAFWMVMGSIALMGLFAAGLDTVDVLLALVLVNTVVAVYMYTVVAEFMLRFCVWVLSALIYRVRVVGHEHIPDTCPCVLVANHVSFVDWFIIAAAVRRPPRFVMHKSFYAIPVMRWLFRQAGVIPIAGQKEDPECLERAFEQIHRDLQDGWVVCIFPEGRITDTGEMYPFRPGIERIVARDPVPVVPVALNGLWGSYFSRKDGRAMSKPFRRAFSHVWVTIGEPVPGGEVDAGGLQERVRALWSTQRAA
jgi:1-acyl-sn-glycerol-3-phosphate acyltransferase